LSLSGLLRWRHLTTGWRIIRSRLVGRSLARIIGGRRRCGVLALIFLATCCEGHRKNRGKQVRD
jgi:hypothetical protein